MDVNKFSKDTQGAVPREPGAVRPPVQPWHPFDLAAAASPACGNGHDGPPSRPALEDYIVHAARALECGKPESLSSADALSGAMRRPHRAGHQDPRHDTAFMPPQLDPEEVSANDDPEGCSSENLPAQTLRLVQAPMLRDVRAKLGSNVVDRIVTLALKNLNSGAFEINSSIDERYMSIFVAMHIAYRQVLREIGTPASIELLATKTSEAF